MHYIIHNCARKQQSIFSSVCTTYHMFVSFSAYLFTSYSLSEPFTCTHNAELSAMGSKLLSNRLAENKNYLKNFTS